MNAIQRIDAEIAALEAKVTALRYARSIVAGGEDDSAPVPETPKYTITARPTETSAKKPSPPAVVTPTEGTKPEGTKTATGTAAYYAANRERRRHELVRYLLKGPAPFGELERITGVQPVTLRMDLDCPYFEKTNPNYRLSPWTLTESGKKFAESNGPG